MLNVGDEVVLVRESDYTKKTKMLEGETYVVEIVSDGCIRLEGFLFFHDMERFVIKGKIIEDAEDF